MIPAKELPGELTNALNASMCQLSRIESHRVCGESRPRHSDPRKWQERTIPTDRVDSGVALTSLSYSSAEGYITVSSREPEGTVAAHGTKTISKVFERGHDETVSSISWSADGECVVSASHDVTIHVWKLRIRQTIL